MIGPSKRPRKHGEVVGASVVVVVVVLVPVDVEVGPVVSFGTLSEAMVVPFANAISAVVSTASVVIIINCCCLVVSIAVHASSSTK